MSNGRKRKVAMSFLDDDLEPPVMLYKKVKQVEQKLNSKTLGLSPQDGLEQKSSDKSIPIAEDNPEDNPENSLEDNPVVVESKELEDERSVLSIPDVADKCRDLLEVYEDKQMHLLFDSPEENCQFRLFLYAVAHGHTRFWPTNELWTRVLRRFVDTPKYKPFKEPSPSKESFGEPSESETKKKFHVSSEQVSKSVTPLKIPQRIRQMLT